MVITRDSRKHARSRAVALLKFTTDPQAAFHHATNISDISHGGLSFLTDVELEKGTPIKFSLLLTSRRPPFEAGGTIAYCRLERKSPKTYRIGIRFSSMSENEKSMFSELLEIFLKKRGKSAQKPLFPLVIRQK